MGFEASGLVEGEAERAEGKRRSVARPVGKGKGLVGPRWGDGQHRLAGLAGGVEAQVEGKGFSYFLFLNHIFF